jgi:hypothetical protein
LIALVVECVVAAAAAAAWPQVEHKKEGGVMREEVFTSFYFASRQKAFELLSSRWRVQW